MFQHSPLRDKSPPASAVATLKIATDISMVTSTLKATICKSVSTTLAFDFARCAVAGARAGSSIVDISIAPDAAQARGGSEMRSNNQPPTNCEFLKPLCIFPPCPTNFSSRA
jgi:hypothetical protein